MHVPRRRLDDAAPMIWNNPHTRSFGSTFTLASWHHPAAIHASFPSRRRESELCIAAARQAMARERLAMRNGARNSTSARIGKAFGKLTERNDSDRRCLPTVSHQHAMCRSYLSTRNVTAQPPEKLWFLFRTAVLGIRTSEKRSPSHDSQCR
jgi:hypothetical protein